MIKSGMAAKSSSTKARGETVDRILDCAELLVQTRGFNGFSYADISAQLHITKASVHHHFPTKAELGKRLIQRYHLNFRAALSQIDAEGGDATVKLRRYLRLYVDVLRDKERMCLCGMLAAEIATLARPLRDALKSFFEMNEEWIAKVLSDGQKERTLHLRGHPRDEARSLLSAFEGAMLVARCFGDVARFRAAAEGFVARLEA